MKALHMTFADMAGENKSFQLLDPRDDITPQAVKEVAEEIVAGELLLHGNQPVKKFTKAYVREISDTELFKLAE